MTDESDVQSDTNTWIGIEDHGNDRGELRRCPWSSMLLAMSSSIRMRSRAMHLANKFEGGQFRSSTYRDILSCRFGVTLGTHSYRASPDDGVLPAGVVIGRYVSIAAGARMFVRNHPFERLSMHPYFYNKSLGYVDHDTIESGKLEVGHDVWLGENSLILPGCHRIGIGAVVGAGAIVTRDVPDFAIVAGNPAKIIRYRFDESGRQAVLSSLWWDNSPEELAQSLPEMLRPIADDPCVHPLVRQALGAHD